MGWSVGVQVNLIKVLKTGSRKVSLETNPGAVRIYERHWVLFGTLGISHAWLSTKALLRRLIAGMSHKLTLAVYRPD